MLFRCSSWQDLLITDDDVPLPLCVFATAHSDRDALLTVINNRRSWRDTLITGISVRLPCVLATAHSDQDTPVTSMHADHLDLQATGYSRH